MKRGSGRNRFVVAGFALALLPGGAAAAPRAFCSAEGASSRALVTFGVSGLFDEDLVRLVRLGLPGKIHLEATLLQARPLWFDDVRATTTRTIAVRWEPRASTFIVDERSVASLTELSFPPLSLRPPDGRLAAGRHHVRITARLEVVTTSSLGQVARWLAAGTGDTRETLPKGLLSYLAADLARSVEARCDVR